MKIPEEWKVHVLTEERLDTLENHQAKGVYMSSIEERLEVLESKVEIIKEFLIDKQAKSFKFYSEKEAEALVEALKDIPLGPEVMKTCQRLIKLGWNDRFDQQRTASALRSKYLRIIGER